MSAFVRIKIIGKFFYDAWKNRRVNQTYFPEYAVQQKSKWRIMCEQIHYIFKYGYPNTFYYLYGFDIKGLRNQEQYVDYLGTFRSFRDRLNRKENSPYVVLRDKSLFGIVAEAYGINTPKNIGIIHNGTFYSFKNKKYMPVIQANELRKTIIEEGGKDFFVKKIDGECADGVYHITICDDGFIWKDIVIEPEKFFNKSSRYLVQKTIGNQHSAISALHPQAINTIRLCTVFNKNTKDVEILSCVLRVGTGENNVDNWAAGGLSIGVDTDKGTLREYGFYKPGYGTKVKEHPDSHIVFNGYNIPYMNDILEQAKEFHRCLYGMHSIGWDIAITDSGPCFVEGNDNWEISLMQISNHGLREEFDRLFK